MKNTDVILDSIGQLREKGTTEDIISIHSHPRRNYFIVQNENNTWEQRFMECLHSGTK